MLVLIVAKCGQARIRPNLLVRNEFTQLETIHAYLDEELRINQGETG